MSRVIRTTDLHNRTRDVLDWARIDGEEVVVQYFGRPAVVILSFDKYQDYLKYKDEQQEKELDGVKELA